MGIKNVSLKMKLIGGFATVILLLLVVSAVGFIALKSASNGFTEYREMARDSNLAGRLQANMLLVRMNVKEFLISGSDKALEAYHDRWQKMITFQEQAQSEIKSPERAKKIDDVEQGLARYQRGFEQVIEYKKQRNELVNEKLNVNGPLMEKALTEIMVSANRDGDVTAAFNAGMAVRNLLLARLYMAKFLDTNGQSEVDRVYAEFEDMTRNIAILDKELENAERRELLAKVRKEEKAYKASFSSLVDAIFKRNDLIDNTMDKIGPVVAEDVEEVKLDIKKVQDEIGPRLQSHNRRAVVSIAGVSGAAVMLGLVIVVLITRGVMVQLGSDPKDIARIAENIAKGNLRLEFDGDESKNKGVYASMKRMTENLTRMIRDITTGVQTLDASSSDLSSVAEQMGANVEQTSDRTRSVAAASEEMSTNMSSVAAATEQTTANIQTIVSAVEEMSATINEIANNTAKGSETTAKAVATAEQVSVQVDELGRAASEISKVTDTIADISEQTNLLALNATIEAARAGEAGKGFAVVAGEIKALAQQAAEATSEISSKINGIQTTTKESVASISSIVKIINEINEIVTTVATAIEEQSATTQEIAKNVTQAASGVNEVNENVNQVSAVVAEVNMDINQVNQATEEVKSGGLQVRSSAEKLSGLASELKSMVGQFAI